MPAVVLVATLLLLGFLPSVVHANEQNQDAMCWTPEQMRGTPGEIAPKTGVRAARVMPPQRTLTPFKPTPSHLLGAIRRVTLPEGKKLIALTFDLCEAAHEIAGYDGRDEILLRKRI